MAAVELLPFHSSSLVNQERTSLCSASYVTVNTTLLTFAADCQTAVDMDLKATSPAADALCSNRSILPAYRAHSSKPAAHHGCGAR